MTGVDQTKGGWTGNRAAAETWEEFDALPVGLKRVYWNAPYNYTALPAHEACRMGLDLVRFAKRRWHNFGLDVRRESARLYGAAQEGWI